MTSSDQHKTVSEESSINVDSDQQSRARWEKLLTQRPMLRSHVSLSPQRYRGQTWYVLHDALTGRQTRINEAAFELIGRLDGKSSTAEVLRLLESQSESGIDPADSIALLQRLSSMGALKNGLPIESGLLDASDSAERRMLRWRRWSSPLAIRIPLLDPDVLLERWTPRLSFLLGRTAFLSWLMLLFIASTVLVSDGRQIGSQLGDYLFSTKYLFMMWCLYPLMKAIHEFSHALVLKKGGGEVHEMGITLLLFTPVPYVDASSTWTFSSKVDRILVSAAGIMAELAIAAVALIFWSFSEPGLLHDAAFLMFLTGSLSTIMFNANPLLKFDGYYVLQDLIEIPNLYSRARNYHIYLLKRYILRVADAPSPVTAPGEKAWMFIYGASAFIYRNVIMLAIAFWLLGKFLIVGFIVTAWVLVQQYVLPAYKAVKYLIFSEELDNRRVLTLSSMAGGMVVIVSILSFVPVPHHTRTEGVVWVPEQAQLFASSAGIVVEVFVKPGANVVVGDLIMRLDSPELDTRVLTLEAKLGSLEAREIAERMQAGNQPEVTIEDVAALRAEIEEFKRQQNGLLVTAKSSGVFATHDFTSLQGRYFGQGDLIGHIVDPGQLVVRAVVPESRIGSVQQGVIGSHVRLAERFGEIIPAQLVHQTPSADRLLPSAALGSAGGGGIAIAPDDKDGLKTVDRVFHLELSLPRDVVVAGVGERAYVSLEHQSVPMLTLWLKSTRQLFLRQLPNYAT